jgi:hypothetical protein
VLIADCRLLIADVRNRPIANRKSGGSQIFPNLPRQVLKPHLAAEI